MAAEETVGARYLRVNQLNGYLRTGRPPLVINPDLVESLAAMGCTVVEIASVVNCSPDTLYRRFAASIKRGRALAAAQLRRAQFMLALQGNSTMLIWLGKNVLGQRGDARRQDATSSRSLVSTSSKP